MKLDNSIQSLDLVVVCNDERNDAWIELLLKQVSCLYMLKAGRCRKFVPDDPDGLSIPRDRLPKKVDAVLFHSSDMKLWCDIQIKATYTFEFNTPGAPQLKTGVIPIFRQTYPYFAVQSTDVDELIAFIAGERQAFPSMCIPPLDVLPAIVTLCQSYLEFVNHESSEIVTRPEWWLEGLGLLKHSQLEQSTYQGTLKRLDAEWENLNKLDISRSHLDRLIASLVIQQPKACEVASQAITYPNIVDAYNELKLVLSSNANAKALEDAVDDATSLPKRILAIRGSCVGVAAATAASLVLGIEREILEPENLETIGKPPRESVLILAESQVCGLPFLRLQNFAGAILVLSTESFSTLKRKYRVLRFGQGSHAAITVPPSLADLTSKLKILVPMEQENLKFFQKEMEALKSFYDQEVIPCLQKLEHPTDSLDSATEEIAVLIEQTRTNTPVACHTVVKVGDETLQIQQHLLNALSRLREQKNLEPTISYLQAIFQQWFKLVQSAAGENLKLAS
ncbi:hypothetical protein ACQ4N7_26355 [Nodosilinea sp. AN01ver1]|uniref:hypothetical protein n=1 Tax=Nodosilinea sp. AN01ver1 TaxID=3423362 RepID=UPI003D318DF5